MTKTYKSIIILPRSILYVLSLLIIMFFAYPVHANGPITIKEQGSFYVNSDLEVLEYPCGVSVPPIPGYCDPGQIAVNQMYVQYQIPIKKHRARHPVIMVHGGSHMGKTYESTPDGREGWRTLFLRAGFPVYVVDLPGRARSSFNPSQVNQALVEGDPSVIPGVGMRISVLERIWSFYRFGPEYPTLNPDSQFPANSLTQYLSELIPNTDGFVSQSEVEVNALVALLERIGPAIIITHSASGPDGLGTVVNRPELVKALVSVEPAGCSVNESDLPAFRQTPALTVFGDFVSGNGTWEGLYEGCQALAESINDAGGHAKIFQLPDIGIYGNSHMLMLEKNNKKTAHVIIKWIKHNVHSWSPRHKNKGHHKHFGWHSHKGHHKRR